MVELTTLSAILAAGITRTGNYDNTSNTASAALPEFSDFVAAAQEYAQSANAAADEKAAETNYNFDTVYQALVDSAIHSSNQTTYEPEVDWQERTKASTYGLDILAARAAYREAQYNLRQWTTQTASADNLKKWMESDNIRLARAAQAFYDAEIELNTAKKAETLNNRVNYTLSAYSGIYDANQDYNSLKQVAASNGNFVDAAIYETMNNFKIDQGLSNDFRSYEFASYLADGKTTNPFLITDSHGKPLGALDFRNVTPGDSVILNAPIIYSDLYGQADYLGMDAKILVEKYRTAGRTEAANYLEGIISSGNQARLQAFYLQIGTYNSIGNLDAANLWRVEGGPVLNLTPDDSSYYANFGIDTVYVDRGLANINAVLSGALGTGGLSQQTADALLQAIRSGALAPYPGAYAEETPGDE